MDGEQFQVKHGVWGGGQDGQEKHRKQSEDVNEHTNLSLFSRYLIYKYKYNYYIVALVQV